MQMWHLMKLLAAVLLLTATVLVPTAGATFFPPVNVSGATVDAFDPQVAMDVDGDAVVVWKGSDGTNFRIRARARSATGTFGPVQPLSLAGQDALDPQVAVDADGDAIFVWERSDGTNSRIEARSRSAAGTLGPIQILSAAGQDAFDPQVAVDTDGDAVAVWRRFDGANYRIQARALSVTGALGSVQTLSAATRDALNPQVAIDPSGNAVVVWQRFDGTNVRISARARAATGGLAAAQVLSAAGQDAFDPQVGVDQDGDAVIVWVRLGENAQCNGSPCGRIQARSRSAAGTLGSVQTLSAAGRNGEGPQVALEADGDAVAAWLTTEINGSSIRRFETSFRSAGGSFGGYTALTATGEPAFPPQLAMSPAGDAVLTWSRILGVFSCCYRAQASARPAGGAFSPSIQTLSNAGQDAFDPQVAVDSTGDALAVWERFDGANWRIQAATGP
jgi:hypothetical protein